MNYYQFHVGDYIKHTAHLEPLEDLAYRRLLDMYYDIEGPIPTDIPLVSRRLRLGIEVVQAMLSEFFSLTESGWANVRANAEIAAYHAFLEKQKANGKLGGRPKKTHRKPTANPSLTQAEPKITLTTTQQPITSNQQPTVEEPDGFALFWSAYPKKTAKPAALKAFRSQKINGNISEILGDIERKAASDSWQKDGGQYIPNPATYLNQRRWEDGTGQQKNVWAGAI